MVIKFSNKLLSFLLSWGLDYTHYNMLQIPNACPQHVVVENRAKVITPRSYHDITYTLQPISLQCNFLHLTVSEILPRYDFKGQGHDNMVVKTAKQKAGFYSII